MVPAFGYDAEPMKKNETYKHQYALEKINSVLKNSSLQKCYIQTNYAAHYV